VQVTALNLTINGNITARGYLGSSGGGINLKLQGGSLQGDGLLDVGVSWDGASADYDGYRAGGGRISIDGYSSISYTLLSKAGMNGAKWGSAPGTLFHRASGETDGHLVVKAVGYTVLPTTRVLMSATRTSFASIIVDSSLVDFYQVYPDPLTIRLVGGSSNSGRLEVKVGRIWGTVCDDAFSTPEIKVACKQLGFPGTGSFATSGYGTLPILMDDLGCRGTEKTLQDCSTEPSDCTHNEDVKLTCTGGVIIILFIVVVVVVVVVEDDVVVRRH
jgi:hypothetical protein